MWREQVVRFGLIEESCGVAARASVEAAFVYGPVKLQAEYFDAFELRDQLASDVENASEAAFWTAGAKWILNPNARVVLNCVYTEFGNPGTLTIDDECDDSENAIVLRAQYDH